MRRRGGARRNRLVHRQREGALASGGDALRLRALDLSPKPLGEGGIILH